MDTVFFWWSLMFFTKLLSVLAYILWTERDTI